MTLAREITRYGLKGAGFVALNIGMQMLLVESGTLQPAVAALLTTAAMPLLGYIAMNRFVFPQAESAPTRRSYLTRFAKYYGVNLSSKAVNYLLFLTFLTAGIWYPLAYLLGAALVFVATFSIHRWLWHGQVLA